MTLRDQTLGVGTKEKNIAKLFKYLSDIDNEWPPRCEYSETILDYKSTNQIYKSMSPEDITKVENDALDSIKAQSCRQRKEIYHTLYKEGKGGDVSAAKEYLDRTEGKVPTQVNANMSGNLTIELVEFCNDEKE
jgi:hypothetical protein